MNREVTERDFRRPEFYDAKVEDYEFDGDGQVVRKDRWETAIRSIRHLVGVTSRRFEISEVVAAVRELVAANEGWLHVGDEVDLPNAELAVEIQLCDGSVLRNARYSRETAGWLWPADTDSAVPLPVTAWREMREPAANPETQPD